MNMLMNTFKRFKNDESGATAIEYGLIAALVSVVIIAALTLLQGSLSETFTGISNALGGAVDDAGLDTTAPGA